MLLTGFISYVSKSMTSNWIMAIVNNVSDVLRIGISEKKFYRHLKSGSQKVLLYEDEELLNAAYAAIPKEVKTRAEIKYQALKSSDIGLQECLVLEMMNWFKNHFFSWTDQPKCHKCGCTKTVFIEQGQPTLEEQKWLANRVEIFRCQDCKSLVRFPRYNHPRKLLDERQGRCGEWSNCFTLLCRAIGLEARLVVDWTDHVWTEVFSEVQNRWMHCDPCECRLDTPLLYEAGWKKKLTYVIAYSKDEVQDVTWRYTSNHKETLSRRHECREEWLIEQIMQLTNMLQNHLPQKQKDELLKRRLKELVEFLKPPVVKDAEMIGRTSGSLEWRIQRNEQGQANVQSAGYIFNLQGLEIAQKLLHVKYSAAKDVYVRVSCGNAETQGWNTCIFQSNSIFRKVEYDWKTAYLARTEGSPEAFINWNFDFKTTDHKISKVSILCESATFENGDVKWTLILPFREVILNGGKVPNLVELDGEKEFMLQATLKGGRGHVAWQHTQLFRQSLNSEYYPFDVQVVFS